MVATPVWAVEFSGHLAIFSAARSGKIKRLGNSGRAKIAVCDMQGKLLGEWHDATAEIVTDPEEIALILSALRAKYGWQMVAADWGAKLTGKYHKRSYIRVSVADPLVTTTSL